MNSIIDRNGVIDSIRDYQIPLPVHSIPGKPVKPKKRFLKNLYVDTDQQIMTGFSCTIISLKPEEESKKVQSGI